MIERWVLLIIRAIHRYASGTAQLYDRRADEVTLDEVERIII